MSRKAKKYSIVLLTVCLSAAVFALTAFAKTEPPAAPSGFRTVALTGTGIQADPETQAGGNAAGNNTGDNGTGENGAGDNGTGDNGTGGNGTGNNGTGDNGTGNNGTGDNGTGDNGTGDNGTGDNGTGGNGTGDNGTGSEENEKIDVTLNYNDGSAPKVVSVAPGTQVKALPVPERKGYEFDCWTMNGVEVSRSLEIYTEIALTARWTVSAASSKASSSYASVDTHESEVEQAASRAAEAISDPDVLSSEDWGSLLSTPSGAEVGTGTLSSAASSQASRGGGGSWLFPVGIGLIVLSACGIGAFIYLQFFSGAGPRIPPGPVGDGGFKNTEFTDISSHSDGPYPAPDAPDAPQAPEAPRPDSEDDTRPVPPQIRRAPASDQSGPAKAQARPVNGEKGGFDWDKFFSDDI